MVSFCLKFALWAYICWKDPGRFLAQDSRSYIDPARALLYTGSYATSPQDPEEPETYRTPGYPVFLAVLFGIFGERYAYAAFVQILLSPGILFFVYEMGNELCEHKTAGLRASILLALDMTSFSYSLLLLSETLFTFLITAMLLAATRFLRNNNFHWLLVTGIVLALGTLVRPVSYYLAIPLLLGLLVLARHLSWKRDHTTRAIASLLLPVFLLVAGWQLRNYLLTGTAQFSSIEGFNLLFYRGADIVAMRDGVDIQEARKRLGFQGWNWKAYKAEHSESPAVSVAKLSEQWRKEGLRLIVAHPDLFIRSELYAIVRMLITTGEGPFVRMLGIPIGKTKSIFDLTRLRYLPAFLAFVFASIYLVLIYVGVLFWFGLTPRKAKLRAAHILLWTTFLYFIVISAGPEAFSRFRVPVMPILTLYASAGLLELTRPRKDLGPPVDPSPQLNFPRL